MFSDVYTGLEKRRNKDMNTSNLVQVKPLVNILETENSIIVFSEMPGVKKEDLNVVVENGYLLITGKKTTTDMEGDYIFRETRDVQYERTFELEKDLDPQKIDANYHAGILEIVIGKKEITKSKKIEIS